jgi:hypothetical protein
VANVKAPKAPKLDHINSIQTVPKKGSPGQSEARFLIEKFAM